VHVAPKPLKNANCPKFEHLLGYNNQITINVDSWTLPVVTAIVKHAMQHIMNWLTISHHQPSLILSAIAPS